jgi:hypothetical protein
MIGPLVGLFLRSHYTLVFQSLDVSISDMAFYPVPVQVPGNLLFLGLDSVILLLFLSSAIVSFLFCSLLYSLSHHLLFRFGCDILRIRIHHWRMGGVGRLLQRRVFFLNIGRVAGSRSWIHGGGG